ncbi:MAG: acyltransferase family protein [Terriglobales bacterium]
MTTSAGSAPAREGTRPAPLPALTGLRFLAAFAVLAFHYSAPMRGRFPAPLRLLVRHGAVGVPLFFVLSGFVLAYNYFPRARAGRFARGGFWGARFARIYPVYLAALVLGGVGVMLRDHISAWSHISLLTGVLDATMVQGFFPVRFNSWNPAAWTLSVEALFYLLFPLLAGLSRLRLRDAATGCGLAAAWILLFNPPQTLSGAWYDPFRFLPLFLLGMLLARLHELRPARHYGRMMAAASGLVALGLLCGHWPIQRLYSVCTVLFGALVLGLASGGGRSWLARRPMLVLGEASYGLYILQMPAWLYTGHFWTQAIRRGWLPAGWNTGTVLFFAVNLACAILLSLVSYYCLERPARGYLRRRLAPAG